MESIARRVPVRDVSFLQEVEERSCIPVVIRPIDEFGEVVGIRYGTVGLESHPTPIRIVDDVGHHSVREPEMTCTVPNEDTIETFSSGERRSSQL